MLTLDSLKSYSLGAIELAKECAYQWKNGYEAMIVPSRGAAPVIEAAISFHRNHILTSMTPQSRGEFVKNTHHRTALQRAYYMPFTADYGASEIPGLDTNLIRKFWVKCACAIMRGNLNDSHYKMFRFMRDRVITIGYHSIFEKYIRSDKIIFIDTIVSGRAVYEISSSFEEEGMNNIYYIFIVDKKGEKMKSPFKEKILELERNGRAKLIYIDDLFTEDQGPAISGIWSVVCPSLMEVAQQDIKEFNGVAGAGIYYHEVMSRRKTPEMEILNRGLPDNTKMTSAISKLNTVLDFGILSSLDGNEIFDILDIYGAPIKEDLNISRIISSSEMYSNNAQFAIESYNEHLDSVIDDLPFKLFDQKSTLYLAEQKIINSSPNIINIDVSGSHCLRANMSKDTSRQLLREIFPLI